jgi:hypothetical protein
MYGIDEPVGKWIFPGFFVRLRAVFNGGDGLTGVH